SHRPGGRLLPGGARVASRAPLRDVRRARPAHPEGRDGSCGARGDLAGTPRRLDAGMIRPEVRALARRWREVIAAAILAAFGFWSMSGGGYVLLPLGIAMTSVAAGWGLIALRRVRFLRGVDAPGLVEVDEGQVGYFGPIFSVVVALADLTYLRLAGLCGARAWRR